MKALNIVIDTMEIVGDIPLPSAVAATRANHTELNLHAKTYIDRRSISGGYAGCYS